MSGLTPMQQIAEQVHNGVTALETDNRLMREEIERLNADLMNVSRRCSEIARVNDTLDAERKQLVANLAQARKVREEAHKEAQEYRMEIESLRGRLYREQARADSAEGQLTELKDIKDLTAAVSQMREQIGPVVASAIERFNKAMEGLKRHDGS